MKSGDLKPADVLDALYRYVSIPDEGYQLRGWDGITFTISKGGLDTYTVESTFGIRKFNTRDVDYVYVPNSDELIKFYLKDGTVVNLELVRVTRYKNVNTKLREILPE